MDTSVHSKRSTTSWIHRLGKIILALVMCAVVLYVLAGIASTIFGGSDVAVYMPGRADNSLVVAKIQELREFGGQIVQCLSSNYSDIPVRYRYFANSINLRYRPDIMTEGWPNGEDTSYVMNKEEELRMCLRDDKLNFHDMHLLKFVMVHELSHMGTIEVEHAGEFTRNFTWLLHFLERHGVYKSTDYAHNPVYYCGKIQLNYNPRYDAGVEI